MSIYPKRISSEENLIIHLRFSNKSKKIQKLKYVLSILNPKYCNTISREVTSHPVGSSGFCNMHSKLDISYISI